MRKNSNDGDNNKKGACYFMVKMLNHANVRCVHVSFLPFCVC